VVAILTVCVGPDDVHSGLVEADHAFGDGEDGVVEGEGLAGALDDGGDLRGCHDDGTTGEVRRV
jgi:hypothetical protein